MFIDDDQEILRRFYTDATNSAAFNTPVKYLAKYDHITDYTIIAHTELQILRLLYLIVSRDLEKASKISQLLAQQQIDERVNPILSTIIANKYSDIKRQLIRRQICRGGPCLLDHNWRIVNVLSTNWTASSNKLLLNLILIVQQKNKQQSEKRINLQLNVHEAEQFLNKLKEIKRSLKS